MDGFKTLPRYKAGGIIKTPTTGNKKAKAPSEAVKRPAFKGSDVAKEKSKPAGHKDPYIKSKEEKQTADFPSAAVKGRNKKAAGTVNKFKCGGGVYGAKKTSSDKKSIEEAKDFKPKKLATGGGVLDTIKEAGTDLKNKIIGTPEQNATAQANLDKQAKSGSKLASFLGGKAK